jgi:hypothetical protein
MLPSFCLWPFRCLRLRWLFSFRGCVKEFRVADSVTIFPYLSENQPKEQSLNKVGGYERPQRDYGSPRLSRFQANALGERRRPSFQLFQPLRQGGRQVARTVEHRQNVYFRRCGEVKNQIILEIRNRP